MTDKPKKQNPIVKTALEMGPLAVFFLTFVRAPAMELGGRTYEPIVLATAGFMIATAISLSVSYALYRKLPVMPMVTGVIVFIFGGLTIYLNDETFIKLKPTIVNLLFCGTLLIGMMFGKSFLKTVLGETIDIDDEGWRKLTLRWGLYFGFLAILNEVVCSSDLSITSWQPVVPASSSTTRATFCPGFRRATFLCTTVARLR